MGTVIVLCTKCDISYWIKKPVERRTAGIPEDEDLECGQCGASYCAKNRNFKYISYDEESGGK